MPKYTTQYTVLVGGLIGQLEEEVAQYIKAGWLPLGGVAVDPGDSPTSSSVYLQGMVRSNPEEASYGQPLI